MQLRFIKSLKTATKEVKFVKTEEEKVVCRGVASYLYALVDFEISTSLIYTSW